MMSEDYIHNQVLKCCESLSCLDWAQQSNKEFAFLHNLMSTKDNFDVVCQMIEMIVSDMLNPLAANHRMQEVYKQLDLKYYNEETDYSKFIEISEGD